jgi:hypothetical protein
MASIGIKNITSDSFTVYLTGLQDVAYEREVDYAVYYADGTYVDSASHYVYISAHASSGGEYTFTGMQPNTEYYVYCSVCRTDTGGYLTSLESDIFSTKSVFASVWMWDWQMSNGSATAEETRAAYNAIWNNEDTRNFSHLVWNDLVNKVKELLDVDVRAWDRKYLSYSDTLMNYPPYKLTADKFNSLTRNLTNLYDTDYFGVVESRNQDYPVKGMYFYMIATIINVLITN